MGRSWLNKLRSDLAIDKRTGQRDPQSRRQALESPRAFWSNYIALYALMDQENHGGLPLSNRLCFNLDAVTTAYGDSKQVMHFGKKGLKKLTPKEGDDEDKIALYNSLVDNKVDELVELGKDTPITYEDNSGLPNVRIPTR